RTVLKRGALMAYTFRLIFSGLCAFVPNRPFSDKEAPPNHVDVILPNLLEGRLVPVQDQSPAILVPHFPYLEFDPRHLQPASGRPLYFQLERVPLKTGARAYCPLGWQDVEIWPEGKKPQEDALRIVNGEPQDPTQPQPGEETRYLRWLIDME